MITRWPVARARRSFSRGNIVELSKAVTPDFIGSARPSAPRMTGLVTTDESIHVLRAELNAWAKHERSFLDVDDRGAAAPS